ncbi:MAG: hypothetical protein D4R76_02305 [Methylococcus sp.]|nr:MAG: hypothetical protein D4R76_02305 [Methylococcus sp.]
MDVILPLAKSSKIHGSFGILPSRGTLWPLDHGRADGSLIKKPPFFLRGITQKPLEVYPKQSIGLMEGTCLTSSPP